MSTKVSPSCTTKKGAIPKSTPFSTYFGVSVKSVHVIPSLPAANRSDSAAASRICPEGASLSRRIAAAVSKAATMYGLFM